MEEFEGSEAPLGETQLAGLDAEFENELVEGVADEIPILGRVRRVYKLIEKKITKPYRQEISRLKKIQETLLTTINNQNDNIKLLREIIAEMELK